VYNGDIARIARKHRSRGARERETGLRVINPTIDETYPSQMLRVECLGGEVSRASPPRESRPSRERTARLIAIAIENPSVKWTRRLLLDLPAFNQSSMMSHIMQLFAHGFGVAPRVTLFAD